MAQGRGNNQIPTVQTQTSSRAYQIKKSPPTLICLSEILRLKSELNRSDCKVPSSLIQGAAVLVYSYLHNTGEEHPLISLLSQAPV